MSKLLDILSHPVSQFLLEKIILPLLPGNKPKENEPYINEEKAAKKDPKPLQEPLPKPLPKPEKITPLIKEASVENQRPLEYVPKYFTMSEFQCKHCGQLPVTGMNPVLLQKLDQLRERIGAPLYVTSGYRCITHNIAVGGVPNSQHIYGNAADIYTDIMNATELAELCKEIGFDGIGLYPQSDFVHVDVRDDGKSPNYYLW